MMCRFVAFAWGEETPEPGCVLGTGGQEIERQETEEGRV